MKNIKKTLVVLILCSFIMGTIPVSVLAQQNSLDDNIFEHKGPDLPDDIQYAPDEIIVKFKEGTSDDTISVINSKNKVVSSEKIIKKNPKAVENEKTNILKKQGLDRIYLLKLPKNSDVNKMVSKYNENPDVEYAELNYKVYVDATFPNEDDFSDLWGMHNTGQSGGTADADIDAPEAWDIETGNSNEVVIAVIDTGVDYTHQDLAANMWTNPDEILNGEDDNGDGFVDDIHGYDFCTYGQVRDNDPMDDSGHGTHCSGTIAAEGNNNIGVVGVSWNAKIMALKFLGASGTGYTADAVPAIYYAIDNGADIISNSWGGGSYSLTLKKAISDANDAGILFVAAAGNSRKNTDRRPHYPSSYDVPNIISVAATDHNDALAGFSNYGPNSVDLGAPGVDILSTYRGDYAWGSGTSMSAPHVSGAAALIMAQNPEISVTELKAKILDSVDLIDALAGKTVTGGRLNVFNCLEANTEPELSITVTPTALTVNVDDNFIVDATISNLGYETATGVEGKITLPLGLSTTDDLIKPAGDISGADSEIVSWNVKANVEGTYTITVEASATNAVSASGTTTVDVVTPDTEPPAIISITGDISTTTGDPMDIVVTAIDNVDPTLARIFIDEDANGIEMTENPDDTFTYTYTAPSDNNTPHTYYVMVYDDADNSVTSITNRITVTDNDAPTADAGPDQTVFINEQVTFNGSASSDNIGITGYSWDYDASDDIQVDAEDEMVIHTYTATGTYTVTLTVTDDADNQDTNTLTVDVIEEANTMHIDSIGMSTTKIKLTGWYTYATATVTIVDASGEPVNGATVSGNWSGLTTGSSDSEPTDEYGKTVFSSDLVKNAAGTFTFTVDDVDFSGLIYDESANKETSNNITV